MKFGIPQKLKVSTSDAIHFINFSNTLYLKSQNNYTYINLTNGKKLLVSKTLKYLNDKVNSQIFLKIL